MRPSPRIPRPNPALVAAALVAAALSLAACSPSAPAATAATLPRAVDCRHVAWRRRSGRVDERGALAITQPEAGRGTMRQGREAL